MKPVIGKSGAAIPKMAGGIDNIMTEFTLEDVPKRKGRRPKTIVGPLHIQCNGHGDPKYSNQLAKDVLTWSHIDATSSSGMSVGTVCFRLEETATSNEPSAFIGPREFARIHLGVPTLVLALPIVWAHWAIVRGWAEPHYLRSFGLMPPGAVLLYSPRNVDELAICYSLFYKSYRWACKFVPERAGKGVRLK
jgi:hypothetical protein